MYNSDNTEHLSEKVKNVWDTNAQFWDSKMGEGNNFHNILIAPTQEKLLVIKQGENVLDIACGNGQFSRRLAQLGANVVAFDISENFIEIAKARTVENIEKIKYLVADANDSEQLFSQLGNRFDAAVCTMAIMDMAEIEPMLFSLTKLLKPQGRFVFSIMHPCFNIGGENGTKNVVEEYEVGKELKTEYSIKISQYIQEMTQLGLGMRGQPEAQLYFHRPISKILNACFKAGFVVDGFEEPVYTEVLNKFSLHHLVYQKIPPALVVRAKLQ